MSPRKYDMSKRSAAIAETRRRIIDATRALHNEQGIAATSWEDIARRAGVGVGTVYRHFPSLDELVPACGEVSMRIVALPLLDEVADLFTGLSDPPARIARLVDTAFAVYERGADDLRAVREEPDVHPALAEAGRHLDAVLGALVDAALAPLAATGRDRQVTRAMIDLGTWKALRDQDLDAEQARAAVSGMLTARIAPPSPNILRAQ
jgi:AcrR family transcriptional regulator